MEDPFLCNRNGNRRTVKGHTGLPRRAQYEPRGVPAVSEPGPGLEDLNVPSSAKRRRQQDQHQE